MKSKVLLVLLFGFILGFSIAIEGPSDYFKASDKAAFKKLLSASKSYLGLKNTYYTVSTLKKLKEEVSDKAKVCESAKITSQDASEIFYAVSIQELLGCGTDASEKLQQDLKKFLSSDSFNNLYYGLSAALTLSEKGHLKNFEKEIKSAAKKLADLGEDDGTFRSSSKGEDGSVLNGGLALEVLARVATQFKLNEEEKSQFENVLNNAQDVFTSFGEEAETTLHLTDAASKASNLRVTASVWKGYTALASALNEKPLSPEQEKIVALTEYFVQHKQPLTPEDAHFVIEGLYASANNNFGVPTVVSLQQSYINSNKDSSVNAEVTNIIGEKVPSKVSLVKAYSLNNQNKAVLSNQELTSDKGLFKLDLAAAKVEPGFYGAQFKVTAEDAKYISSVTTKQLKIVTSISVTDTQVLVADGQDAKTLADAKKFNVENPKSLQEAVSINQNQVLLINFKVKEQSGKLVQVQQAFVRISNEKYESIHVAKNNGKQYSAAIKAEDLVEVFYGQSGSYQVELIVGDSFVSNPVQWKVGQLAITFNNNSKLTAPQPAYSKLPEIEHLFRPADKRADAAVSFAFTLAVLAPLLVLLGGFARVGANFSNFPMGASFIYAVGFHGSFGAILALYSLYWLSLNMVQTLKLLGVLLVPYLFFASKTLNYLVATKSHQQ